MSLKLGQRWAAVCLLCLVALFCHGVVVSGVAGSWGWRLVGEAEGGWGWLLVACFDHWGGSETLLISELEGAGGGCWQSVEVFTLVSVGSFLSEAL